MAAESRVDLLNWVNETLNLNYTKVEQLGTGAAYCQLIDSIYLDVPMNRVKFSTTKEYEYLNNFKILQSSFVKHKITKTIPVEKLIKCRFQDNLEFFQWIRKFWKENKDELEYDPDARRKYAPSSSLSSAAPSSSSSGVTSGGSTLSARQRGASQTPAGRSASGSSFNGTTSTRSAAGSRVSSNNNNGTLNGISLRGVSRPGSRVSSFSNPISKDLENELNQTKATLQEKDSELAEYKIAVDALETERNFYFNKLREIEILTEATSEILKNETEGEEQPNLKDILIKIQEVLYSTEEGFQVPDDEEINNDINMEEETF
jgi:RP/EB family microtubule-associated protein